MAINQLFNTGLFVPTTNVWDVQQLYQVDIKSPEFKELIVRLYQNVNNIALALNAKESGLYAPYEFVTGEVYSLTGSNSQNGGFRTMIITGTVGPGTTSINHNLDVKDSWLWVEIYGCLTDSVNFLGYPINFADSGGNTISASVNATQIVINNNSGVSFTNGMVILKYIKTQG